MYRFVFVYKAHGKWNRQLSRFRYKMVVKDDLRILSMYSRCNNSHSNLFIHCKAIENVSALKLFCGQFIELYELNNWNSSF
jgi:hypothetical protein